MAEVVHDPKRGAEMTASFQHQMKGLHPLTVYNIISNLASTLAYDRWHADLEKGSELIDGIAAHAKTVLAINIQGLPSND